MLFQQTYTALTYAFACFCPTFICLTCTLLLPVFCTTFARLNTAFYPVLHDVYQSSPRITPNFPGLARLLLDFQLNVYDFFRLLADLFRLLPDFYTSFFLPDFSHSVLQLFSDIYSAFTRRLSHVRINDVPLTFACLFVLDLCSCELTENSFARLMKASLIPQVPGHHHSQHVSKQI